MIAADTHQRSLVRARRLTLVAVALVVAIVDGVTKVAASASLDDGPISLLGPLSLRLGHNSGVAFGLGSGSSDGLMVAVTAAVIVALAAAAWRGVFGSSVGAGLVLGGAIGNFVDRASNGSVVDMIDLRWWPTFNVADIAITLGVVLLVLTETYRSSPHRRRLGS